jgi:phenylacetate-CoA ligase
MWMPTNPEFDEFKSAYFTVDRKYLEGTMSRADWREWKDGQLQKVLHKAKKHSRFYANHLEGIDISAIHSDDLSALPFTTKDHLREAMFDILSGDLREALFFYETTGTTGKATPCPRGVKEVLASNAQLTHSFREIFERNFAPGYRPLVALMVPTEVHSSGDTLGAVCQNLGSCNAKIWPYSPVIGFKKCLQLLQELKADVMFCTPGVAMTLAKAAEHYGLDIAKDLQVKVVMTTGEMCTPSLAANIASIWNAKVYNALYGAQETLIIASADADNRMHLAYPNYIFEVINPETGVSLGEQGEGELCVTMLMDGIKPLIRYRTGDLVHIRASAYRSPEIEIVGRTKDRIVLGGQPRLASQIEEAVLSGLVHCHGYRITISETNGRDHVDVQLDYQGGRHGGVDPSAVADRIALRFHEQFSISCNVSMVDELDSIVNTGALVSWKAARINDTRRPKDSEEEAAAIISRNRHYRT